MGFTHTTFFQISGKGQILGKFEPSRSIPVGAKGVYKRVSEQASKRAES